MAVGILSLAVLPSAQLSFSQVDKPPTIEFKGWDKDGKLLFVAEDDHQIVSIVIVQDGGEPIESTPKGKPSSFSVLVPPPDVGLVNGVLSVYTVTAKDNAGQTKTLNVLVGVVPEGAQEEVEFQPYTIDKELTKDQQKTIEDELKKNGKEKTKNNPDNLKDLKVTFETIDEGHTKKTKITVKGKLIDPKNPGATFSRFDPVQEDFLIVAELCIISHDIPICPESTPVVEPVVGGELLPIDTTALFVAGVFTNAYWILPTLGGIAGAAFALFKVKRKSV